MKTINPQSSQRNEKTQKILILGGSGNTGEKIAQLLLQYSDVQITLAARNEANLRHTAEKLNQPQRVQWKTVDASNTASLVSAFVGVNMVVSAGSTAKYTTNVVQACLTAKSDYLDVQYSGSKVKQIKALKSEIEQSGHCFISEAGFHPGLPAVLVRYAATKIESLESALTYSAISVDMKTAEVTADTSAEFVSELLDYDTSFLKDGHWRKAGMWSTKDFRSVDFGEPAGKKMCVPMFFEELRHLPHQIPSLQNTGFYIAGFGWFADYVAMPVVLMMVKLSPQKMAKPMGQFFVWAWKKSSKPPFYTMMKLEAKGKSSDNDVTLGLTLSHEDGYMFTAIPVVACLLQYLDSSIRQPGLHWMGQVVKPIRLMDDMARMGITFRR